jgi:hypothetical protein
MFFRGLPLEIQSWILQLCSPSDLAVLSRVHTSGRDLAEYALYSCIQYRARPSDLIISVEDDEGPQELKEDRSLLHTFANNSRKASMVKMFYVELVDGYDADDEVEHEDEIDEVEHEDEFDEVEYDDESDDLEHEDEVDETIGFHESHGYRSRIKSTDFILVKLAEALVKMSNLVDLRILHSPMGDSDAFQGTRRISEVIRFVFRSGNDSD